MAPDGPCRKGTLLAVCARLILLRILEGKAFISKLPIASGLTEILTFSHLSLSISLAITYFFSSSFSKSFCPCFSFRCEQQCFPSSCQANFAEMFEISQRHPISTNYNEVSESARRVSYLKLKNLEGRNFNPLSQNI